MVGIWECWLRVRAFRLRIVAGRLTDRAKKKYIEALALDARREALRGADAPHGVFGWIGFLRGGL